MQHFLGTSVAEGVRAEEGLRAVLLGARTLVGPPGLAPKSQNLPGLLGRCQGVPAFAEVFKGLQSLRCSVLGPTSLWVLSSNLEVYLIHKSQW